MTIRQEPARTGEHILSEANGTLSRDAITLIAGTALPAGQVLGRVAASGNYKAYSNAASDGSEVAVMVLYSAVPESASVRQGVASARHTEMIGSLLTGLDSAAITDLAAQQIIVR